MTDTFRCRCEAFAVAEDSSAALSRHLGLFRRVTKDVFAPRTLMNKHDARYIDLMVLGIRYYLI